MLFLVLKGNQRETASFIAFLGGSNLDIPSGNHMGVSCFKEPLFGFSGFPSF